MTRTVGSGRVRPDVEAPPEAPEDVESLCATIEELETERRHAQLLAEADRAELAIALESIARLQAELDEARLGRVVIFMRSVLRRSLTIARYDPHLGWIRARLPESWKRVLRSAYWRVTRTP